MLIGLGKLGLSPGKYFLLGLIFLSLHLNIATAQEPPTSLSAIPIETLFDRVDEYDHTISPNGKYLASIKALPRFYMVYITDLDKHKVIYRTPISKRFPSALTWLNDRRLMFRIAGRIYAINIDGTDQRVLIDWVYSEKKIRSFSTLLKSFRRWHVENILRDDNEHIMVSSINLNGFQSIHKINVFTGEKIDLYDGDKYRVNKWILDHAGEVAFAIKNDKDISTFYQFDERGKLAKSSGLNNRFNFDNSGKTHLKRRAIVVGSLGEDNEIYLTENISSDRFKLLSYDHLTDKSQIIYEDERYDVGSSDSPPRLILSNDNQKLVGIRYRNAKEVTIWLADKYQSMQDSLDRYYPDKINTILQWSNDFERILFRSWDEKSHGKTMIFMPSNKKSVVQNNHLSSVLPEQFAKTDIIKYQAKDGYEIEAYLTLPPAFVTEGKNKLPLIVMPHGGPFARTDFRYNPYVQYFASQGYAVIEPNFRGSVGYGFQHLVSAKASIHEVMIDDIADSARWAINEGIADSERTFILGFSYGGYAAIMSSLKYPSLFKAAVSYSAPLNIKKQLQWYKKNNYHFAYEYWHEMVLGGSKNSKFLKSISPYYQLQTTTVPTYIYHGEKDQIVPVVHAEDLKKKWEKSGRAENINITLMKAEGHNINIKSNKMYFAEKAIAAFEKASVSAAQ